MARKTLAIAMLAVVIFACSGDDNLVNQATGFIIGRVTADGVGIPGVTIRVSAYIYTDGGTGKQSSFSGTTGSAADGDYRIEVLPGKYRIDYTVVFDGELLFTARYPIEVAPNAESKVDVNLKDPVPASLLAVEKDAVVKLSWEPGYNSQSHRFYRSPAGEEDFEYVGQVINSSGSTVYATDIPPSISSYDYRVTSVSEGVESEPSSIVNINFTGAISAPTGFDGVDLITHVALSWNEKLNVAQFKIYRAVSSPESWILIDSTAELSYVDIPEDYSDYFYYVTAVSPYGTESPPSLHVMVAFDGRYDPPSGLTLVDRGSNFYLTWLDDDYLGYFNIYRSLDPGGNFVKIDSSLVSHYEDIPTVHDFYYYRVSVVGHNGLESDKSDSVGAFFDGRLDPPEQIQAVDLGLSVEISWNFVSWAGAYILYRSDDGEVYHQIARVSSNFESYIDQPPQAGTYYYKISTETIDGVEGLLSEAISVYFTDNLTRPENVQAQSFGTYVEISWDHVEDATGYKIYRSTSSGGGYVEIGTSDNTGFTDVPQSAGPYYYKVKATDDAGHESPFSFYAYVYFTGIPLPPSNVRAIDDSFKVEINWDSDVEAYDFIVYRASSPSGEYLPVDTVMFDLDTDWPSTAGHYYYKVQAYVDFETMSELSDDAHVYFSGILGVPTNLQADTTGGYVSLTWDHVTGASEYDVYRGLSPDVMELIQTVYAPECTDAPDSGGTYYYAVAAITQGGLESPRSSPVVVVYEP
jgi:fibronectin type 3 domain-containing protein